MIFFFMLLGREERKYIWPVALQVIWMQVAPFLGALKPWVQLMPARQAYRPPVQGRSSLSGIDVI